MPTSTRRDAFKAIAAGAALAQGPLLSGQARGAVAPRKTFPRWGRGIEGQRRADLGDGTYRNPIVAGDHPDPTVLKDGDVYYMTHSSFLSCPGLLVWRSTDLVNWAPVGSALPKPPGTVWAADLCKHEGRYYIYFPSAPEGSDWSIFVVHAQAIEGPWSDPVDLSIKGCIDPGHVVGEDGHRYLFVNGIRKIRLAEDGLATAGPLEPAYNPWHYPENWVVEAFSPEGPKLLCRDGWFYLVTAVGGTAGPPTSHMVIVARSKSVHGPWEDCPHNPILHTASADEPWWSRGHATLVEGPAGDWWAIYHGYENGFRTLGRQTLLEPVVWTADGWPKGTGGDLSHPLPKPRGGTPGPAGLALSDDFSFHNLGLQWSFHEPAPDEMARLAYGGGALTLAGRGTSPADSSPLTCLAGDRAYEVEIVLERQGHAEGGLLLFYNRKAFIGLGFSSDTMKTWEYSQELVWARTGIPEGPVRLRMTNDDQVIAFHISHDGGATWRQHMLRMEVSGFHHNVFGGFLALRPAIYSIGTGAVTFRDFRYRGLG